MNSKMISREEIKKLADLARVEIKEEELESLRGEMDSILDYVGQVSYVASGEAMRDEIELGANFNVMREDGEPTPSGTYSKELIAEFPDEQGGYLKVKKIL
jgi:aspartyl-tRNA(Asn)/glutamyl-tRNA(Gln) amidotransferase subunit C